MTKNFSYDANGYLANATDWNNNATKWTNNVRGLPTRIQEGVVCTVVARTTSIVYDRTFVHLPATTTTQGLKTSFTYDSEGNVSTRTLTDTTVTTIPYSTQDQTRTWIYTWSNGLLQSVQSPRTDLTAKTIYQYSSDGERMQLPHKSHWPGLPYAPQRLKPLLSTNFIAAL